MENKILNSLIKTALKNKTPLGNNEALPEIYDKSYEYEILKIRFNDIYSEIQKLSFLENYETNYLTKILGKKLNECQEIERPIRDELEKICGETVVKVLGIPEGTMTITCELVDEIVPNYKLRIVPENDDKEQIADNVDDLKIIKKEILKRRLINSLIQGASYRLSDNEYYISKIYKIDKRLVDLYNEIRVINDYLLFTTNIKLSEEKNMQGSYVESILGRNGELSSINSQGLIFPLLLQETIRGCMEVFSSHYIINNKNYKTIIKNSDYLQAEQWDMRLGVTLWDKLTDVVNNTELIPYYFSSICNLNINEFNKILNEIYSNTKLGHTYKEDLLKNVQTKFKLNKLTKNIEDECFGTTEGYFSASELNDFLVEDNDNYDNIINILHNVNVNDIDFEVGKSEDYSIIPQIGNVERYQIYPVIHNIEIPIDLINFNVEPRVIENETLYQVHLFLSEKIQHEHIGYKILYSFLMKYGNIYIGFGRLLNHNEMVGIINHFSRENNIKHAYVKSKNNKIIGIKFEMI